MVREARFLIHLGGPTAVVTCIESDVKGFPYHRRISRGGFELASKARMNHSRRVYGFFTLTRLLCSVQKFQHANCVFALSSLC